jgi:phosphoribosylformylglycinamidine synthase
MRQGWVRACHDCSEGGLGVAAAEMALAGGWGAALDLRNLPRDAGVDRDDVALFSESLGRFLVEVPRERQREFEAAFHAEGLPIGLLGTVQEAPMLAIVGLAGREVLRLPLADIRRAWRGEDA